jgi:hypothetical protein
MLKAPCFCSRRYDCANSIHFSAIGNSDGVFLPMFFPDAGSCLFSKFSRQTRLRRDGKGC